MSLHLYLLRQPKGPSRAVQSEYIHPAGYDPVLRYHCGLDDPDESTRAEPTPHITDKR